MHNLIRFEFKFLEYNLSQKQKFLHEADQNLVNAN